MAAHLSYRLLVASLWIFWGGIALAQQCPPGQIAYGSGPGLNMCGPDRRQQQAPQPPPQQWERRWGAIATDIPKGIVEAITDKSSKREAERAAMANCTARGGSPCKLEIAYDNECVAMTVGSKAIGINTGNTNDAAVQRAMQSCNAVNTPDCHVYYSACSLPARTQ